MTVEPRPISVRAPIVMSPPTVAPAEMCAKDSIMLR